MSIKSLILSAGKQSRFEIDSPKALSLYNNIPILDINLETLHRFTNDIYLVCNENNYKWFKKYEDILNVIVIESGYGDGDAIYRALKKINIKNEYITIQWCDAIFDNPSVHEILVKNLNENFITIPVVYEDNPYVKFEYIDNNVKVTYSKYNEVHSSGYHDLSLFGGYSNYIYNAISNYHDKFKIEHGIYKSKRNNEFSFLDIFNENFANGKLLNIENYKAKSFNTLKELNAI